MAEVCTLRVLLFFVRNCPMKALICKNCCVLFNCHTCIKFVDKKSSGCSAISSFLSFISLTFLCHFRCVFIVFPSFSHNLNIRPVFIYLFGVLRRFQHCTCHITAGSWKGRGNQYIQRSVLLPVDQRQATTSFPT